MDASAWLLLFVDVLCLALGAYLLSFRPLDRRAAWLAATSILMGLSLLAPLLDWPITYARYRTLLGGTVFLGFVFVFPTRLRWASPAGVGWCAAAGLIAASWGYQLSGGTADETVVRLQDRLLSPGALGSASAVLLAMLGRLTDVARLAADNPVRRAAPFFLLIMGAGVITGGGFVAGQTLAALLGPFDFPLFFYEGPSGIGYLPAGIVTWWLLPGAIAVYGARHLRWWTPTVLIAAGVLSYAPIAFADGLDPTLVIVLRLWGNLLAPALALYAQARWAPFSGEPTHAATGWSIAAFFALAAYAFVFIAAVSVSPAGVATSIAAPVLALLAAVGMFALALPQARRVHVQRLMALASQDRLAPGATLLGRYRITGLLGEGGQGRVYEATDRKRGNARVVLKAVTNDDAVREAHLLKGFDHPNILRFVEIVEVPGFTLLVLEFAEGGTLRGLLTRKGRLAAAEAHELVDGVLAGLAQAHKRGVAHRDVKPENILLSQGVPKLADFGLAQPAGPNTTMRTDGKGTLAYLAPEQVRGEAGDLRSDVYAAGILVHEVLTGAHPFPVGSDDFLTRQAILTKPPSLRLGEQDRALAAVLRRALAKDPAARFASATELRAGLRAAWSS